MSHIPLTDEEIEFVKNEIRAIGADESVFVFTMKHILIPVHVTIFRRIRYM